jgi:hypothetical protein
MLLGSLLPRIHLIGQKWYASRKVEAPNLSMGLTRHLQYQEIVCTSYCKDLTTYSPHALKKKKIFTVCASAFSHLVIWYMNNSSSHCYLRA